MQAVLDRAIALLDGPPPEEPVILIGFRSVAPDFAALVAATVEDAFREAEAQGARVVAAEVSGVMPIDEGMRCWGFVSVVMVPAEGASTMPRVTGSPAIERGAGTIAATFSLAVERGVA